MVDLSKLPESLKVILFQHEKELVSKPKSFHFHLILIMKQSVFNSGGKKILGGNDRNFFKSARYNGNSI